MKWSITLVLISLSFYQSSGQIEEQRIAQEVCIELSKIDLTQPTSIINVNSTEAFQTVYQQNDEVIQKLYKQRSKQDKQASLDLISTRVGQEITYYLMYECEQYQRITMFKNKEVPKISPLTDSVGLAFTEVLIQWSKEANISRNMVDQCLTKITDHYSEAIEKRFGDKEAPEFIAELQAFLMTRCEPYMRWTASLVK